MLSATYYPVGPAQWGMPQGYAPEHPVQRASGLWSWPSSSRERRWSSCRRRRAFRPRRRPPRRRRRPRRRPPPPTTTVASCPSLPQRVLDTRSDYGGAGPVAAFGTATVNVTGALGVAPAAVAAVALNVTVTRPAGARLPDRVARRRRCRWPPPSTSSPGRTVPNGVLVGIDAAGTVSIFAGAPAPVDVLVDVTGWVPAGAGFTPVTPVRVLETRAGSPGYTGGTRFGRNETRLVDVVGRAGLPAGQVGAVAVNLTVDRADRQRLPQDVPVERGRATDVVAELRRRPGRGQQPGARRGARRRGGRVRLPRRRHRRGRRGHRRDRLVLARPHLPPDRARSGSSTPGSRRRRRAATRSSGARPTGPRSTPWPPAARRRRCRGLERHRHPARRPRASSPCGRWPTPPSATPAAVGRPPRS